MSTPMNVSDRQATEKYAAELRKEFGDNTIMLSMARDLGDMEGYRIFSAKNAVLYREIQEVEVALNSGLLPS